MESYGFENKRTGWDTIPPFLVTASTLRTAHIRDPQGPQTTYSSECFWDEVATHLKQDPIEFRLRYLQAPRDINALKAVAALANAVFDATGVRFRRLPLTPKVVLAALTAHQQA